MKIQTDALLKSCSVDGTPIEVSDTQPIELEFSAVDTGGGFHDAILDFSFVISLNQLDALSSGEISDPCEIRATMQNPDEKDRTVSFSCISEPAETDSGGLEINGRLKDDQVSREITGFMLHLLR